ncbi:MAG: YigZ family protein [Enterobacterales bacterium]|nr:YigZ family protein [Enterobacterales bacterium]
MSDSTQVPTSPCCVELEVKKSRFICQLLPCDNKGTAKALLASVRSQFADANHHCWAYQIGPDASLLQACSDDGEPHGTAGRPMLNVLAHAGVTNVLAVVSRIFGGTKLGTGGLARAYSQAVKQALCELKTVAYVNWQKVELQLDYANENHIRQVLSQYNFQLEQITHEQIVTMCGRIDESQSAALIAALERLALVVKRLK